jgi:UPF0755 protein
VDVFWYNESMKKRKKKLTLKRALPIISILVTIFAGSLSFYVFQMKTAYDLSVAESLSDLANPSARYVKVAAGMRREEVADRFAKSLGWSDAERNKLLNTHTLMMKSSEGYYFPETYVVSINASAQDVSRKISDTFNEKIAEKVKGKRVSIDTIIKIASIIQREASPYDMRVVSGIIWNRIDKGMALEMDATLQYAKGNKEKWWPLVNSQDKYIDSPYNTYKNKGLPPSAISNPGEAAIDAALNPSKTQALFYIHDDYGNIHTAATYEQHKANIAAYY